MKSYSEVEEILFSQRFRLDTEHVDLREAMDRVLAEDMLADIDMPPFDRSAMDGYACRKSDIKRPLKIVEEIPAGKVPEVNIQSGTASKIMTGAPIPEGADWVIRVEDTRLNEKGEVVILDIGKSSNIRCQGEDQRAGELVMAKGTMLNRQHIGNLAAIGKTRPLVYKQPAVGIINTGSEIINPNEFPGKSQIRNSNGPQLIAQLQSIGIPAKDYGIVKDHKSEIEAMIVRAMNENDILLISGGVSAGDYDFVPKLLESAGYEILVHKMKVRPGKPLLFARKDNKYVFGIPGNPVSTLVQFEVAIRNFIFKFMGVDYPGSSLKMVAGEDMKNKKLPLRIFLPVKFNNGAVFSLPYNGSGHLGAWAVADVFLKYLRNLQ